jgi:glycosyltransferase involved in cell wall biosynthesis
MRICFLTENYPPQRGGMSQSCDRIVDGLRKRDFVIDVVHFASRTGLIKTTQQINGAYISVPFEDSEAHTLNLTWNYIERQTYDLLICFGGYLPVLAAPVYAKWMGLPLVAMLRGNDFDAAIFTPRKRDLLQDALLASSHVCVVSRDKKQKLSRLFPDVKVSYVPNGIELSSWHPSPSEISMAKAWRAEHTSGKVCIGVFGQLKAKKGLDLLLRSLLSLERNHEFHLLLIGEIGEEMQEMLISSALSYSHFSFMDRFELIKYYVCCDAVAIPSYYDGMPNVLLEASALGIPVLAAKIDGMKDLMQGVTDELLFEPGDHKDCRHVLSTFLNAEIIQRLKWGSDLKNIIETKFTNQHETDAYEKIIATLPGFSSSSLRLQSS